MKTITLRVEDCDQVVIDELKDSYQMHNQCKGYTSHKWGGLFLDDGSDDILEPDFELLKAILTVLEYYMPPDDYKEWVEKNSMVMRNNKNKPKALDKKN